LGTCAARRYFLAASSNKMAWVSAVTANSIDSIGLAGVEELVRLVPHSAFGCGYDPRGVKYAVPSGWNADAHAIDLVRFFETQAR
jgi:hypothetical protein